MNFRIKILLDVITDTNETIPFMIIETEDKQEFFVRVNDQEVFTYEQFTAVPKKEIRWNIRTI